MEKRAESRGFGVLLEVLKEGRAGGCLSCGNTKSLSPQPTRDGVLQRQTFEELHDDIRV